MRSRSRTSSSAKSGPVEFRTAGLPALLDRFRVGRVVVTPTFAEKPTPGVRVAVQSIERAHVPTLIVHAGDRLASGDVTLDILHPPADGPPGIENVRSMVVRVQHAGRCILLTGDLQGAGLDTVLRGPRLPIDVLQAPHHGSKTSNTPPLAEWAAPRVVVSCEGPPTWVSGVPAMYVRHGARYLGTWPHGAVTITTHQSGMVVETFRTRERFLIHK